MKNQSDLIVTVVAVLCMLIGVGVFFGTKKEAVKPAPPEAVVQAPLQLPAANVVMASSLPGGGGGGGMGGPAGMSGGRMGGGPMGMGGPGGMAPANPAKGGGGGPMTSGPAVGPGAPSMSGGGRGR